MKKLLFALLALIILPQQILANDHGPNDHGVVSSADPRAAEAGAEILRKGGTAADAAMAMMLALTVVEPQSSGIGGGGFLVYQNGEDGALSTVNGREMAPAGAKPDRFMGADGKPLPFLSAFPGGKSVGIPGNIRLMALTHKKWGKLPWKDLFGPAIKLAEQGYEVNATQANALAQIAPLWDKFPEAQAIYWRDGKPVPKGTWIKNPALAKTLKTLAAKGEKAFYTGAIAKQIVAATTKTTVAPSEMTLADMAAYKAKEQNAVCAPYRVYVVCGMAPPSSGATTVLQILGLLERFDMTALGKDNPQSWHLIHQAMRLAYADRDKYLGDSDFVSVPVQGLLDPNYVAQRSQLINPDKALNQYDPGTPPGAMARTPGDPGEVAGTTHFVAVDKNGDIATMTSTIEGPFGSQLIAGGFFLNNELTDFTFTPEKDGAPVANRVEGKKRPLSSMSPTIVYNAQGEPVLALGSAGGRRIIMHVTKTLIGALDFGLPLDQAIALPNIFFTPDNKVMLELDRAPEGMKDKLSAFGAPAVDLDFPSKVNGVQLTAKGWAGAADPRSPGIAISVPAGK